MWILVIPDCQGSGRVNVDNSPAAVLEIALVRAILTDDIGFTRIYCGEKAMKQPQHTGITPQCSRLAPHFCCQVVSRTKTWLLCMGLTHLQGDYRRLVDWKPYAPTNLNTAHGYQLGSPQLCAMCQWQIANYWGIKEISKSVRLVFFRLQINLRMLRGRHKCMTCHYDYQNM